MFSARASLIFTSFILLNSPAAFAINCMHKGLETQVRNMVEKVAIIEEEGEDGRRTEEEYAAENGVPVSEVQNRFAATGIIKCGKYTGTAQLTGSNDTITTVAHMFSGASECTPGVPPESCTFTTKNGNDVQTEEISELVGKGFKCPKPPRKGDDWAVLKLRNSIKGVKPYRTPSLNENINADDKVISIAGSSDDFQRADKRMGKMIFPKSIESCQVKQIYLGLFASTCDFSGGNSGGSVLRQSESGDVLLGISKGNNESKKERENALIKNIVRREKYNEGKWATYHVPVAGEFLDTIERANVSSPR